MPTDEHISTGPDPAHPDVQIRIGRTPDAQTMIDKAVTRALSLKTPDRLRVIAEAMRFGFTDEEIQADHGV